MGEGVGLRGFSLHLVSPFATVMARFSAAMVRASTGVIRCGWWQDRRVFHSCAP